MSVHFDDGPFIVVLLTEKESLEINRHYDEVVYEGHSGETAMASALFDVLGEEVYERIDSNDNVMLEEVFLPTHVGEFGDLVCSKTQ